MIKKVLAFRSKADMAEFALRCRIIGVDTDAASGTLTGYFSDEDIALAQAEYEGHIAPSPDFILPS